MFRKMCLIAVGIFFLIAESPAQTTNGLMTGTVVDSQGAVVPGAEVDVKNELINQQRIATTDTTGSYTLPQLPPGVYDVSVKKQGFATVNRPHVQLEVNQNATLNFTLTVSSTQQTLQVTGAPPPLNTTSATLGDVVGHQATVDLPLNGREFTQLTLLSPGAAPIEQGQQSAFTVALGAGGISPAVNGQSGYENNFTLDGVENNSLFSNVWLISPPPDALQEFNVQSDITDAQFGVSSGANINIATRAGTETFHGSAWEFARNAVMDGKDYFDTTRLPYSQNQYGVYLGGPVILPHFNGRNSTWFSAYWEGFRSSQTLTYFAGTLTAAMRTGDFSAILGPQVGTDDLGRPEYQNEIYDPSTSRPDPVNPAAVIRDPFPGNKIPTADINLTAPIILQKYYPEPNLNVASGVLPNLSFPGDNSTASDVTGIRLDHHLPNSDYVFGRYNRTDANLSTPEPTPGYVHTLNNYGQTVAIGYTHLIGTTTILNLRYAWTHMTLLYNDAAAGMPFNNSINFSLRGAGIPWGPSIGIANGYSGVSQTELPLGPQTTNEIHADLSKVIGNHTLGFGGVYEHIYSYNGVSAVSATYTQNATAQGATAGPTGYGPASFMLGLPDSIGGYTGPGLNQTMNDDWYAGYIQDTWRATAKLTLTAGLRYDLVTSPTFSDIVSGLDIATGKFLISGPFLPLFPKATGPKGFYYTQFNGFQPRFGAAYQVSARTVLQAAFAIMDDHNHGIVQEDQNLRLSWPEAVTISVSQQNRDLPNLYLNNLPSSTSFIDPLKIYIGSSSNPNNKIPYSMEYNMGIEQQLPNSMVLNLHYVGSLSRHQGINPAANTAKVLGPGSLASRGQPYPQYGGGAIGYEENAGSGAYNALQVGLKRNFSSGLEFSASYTWSKSMDIQSDVYGGSAPQNFYNLNADWGPSNYDLRNLFVFGGVYALPIGRGKALLSTPNRFMETLVGNWNVGAIVSLHTGEVFDCNAGADIANAGGGDQRCNKVGNPYGGAGFKQTKTLWLNPASFTVIPYTFGTEHRNDLVGPPYKDVDFNVFKDFRLTERMSLQIRAESFNLLNHTNFDVPNDSLTSSAFGKITGSNFARENQLAVKVIF